MSKSSLLRESSGLLMDISPQPMRLLDRGAISSSPAKASPVAVDKLPETFGKTQEAPSPSLGAALAAAVKAETTGEDDLATTMTPRSYHMAKSAHLMWVAMSGTVYAFDITNMMRKVWGPRSLSRRAHRSNAGPSAMVYEARGHTLLVASVSMIGRLSADTGDVLYLRTFDVYANMSLFLDQDDDVFYTGGEGHVWCCFVRDASVKWTFKVKGGYGATTVAKHNGKLYVGCRGAVNVLDPATGLAAWRVETKRRGGVTMLFPPPQEHRHPDDQALMLFGHMGLVEEVNARTQTATVALDIAAPKPGRHGPPKPVSMLMHGDDTMFLATDRFVAARDLKSGTIKWQINPPVLAYAAGTALLYVAGVARVPVLREGPIVRRVSGLFGSRLRSNWLVLTHQTLLLFRHRDEAVPDMQIALDRSRVDEASVTRSGHRNLNAWSIVTENGPTLSLETEEEERADWIADIERVIHNLKFSPTGNMPALETEPSGMIPVLPGSDVLFVAGHGSAMAINPTSGGILWTSKVLKDSTLMPMLMYKAGQLILGLDGRIVILDPCTGRVMFERNWHRGLGWRQTAIAATDTPMLDHNAQPMQAMWVYRNATER